MCNRYHLPGQQGVNIGTYTMRSESLYALIKVLEVKSTSIYTGLNKFNFIRKHFLQICVRKFAVHLLMLLEVMSTSVDTDNQIYVP
jgi:hypothetical protein